MRRIVIWLLSTSSTLVLLFSYHTSTSSTAAPSTVVATGPAAGAGSAAATSGDTLAGGSAGGTTTGDTATGGTATGGTATGGTTTGGSTAGGTRYAGAVVPTRFGNVQVQITVADHRITSAGVLQIPDRDRKDVQINNRAVPILNQAAVAAQSADLDMVSGATITSLAYRTSLQSAIDQAHL